METEDPRTFWERLEESVRRSFQAMEPFRRLRQKLITEYVGPGLRGENRRKPLQKLTEAVEAYVTLLVGGDPSVRIESIPRDYDGHAFVWQHALNQAASDIHMRTKIERWVLDSCFLQAIMRAHMADSGKTENLGGILADPGKATLSNISYDDWVIDMAAKSEDAATYVGDKYRIRYSQFQREVEQGMYDEEVAKMVVPGRDSLNTQNRTANMFGGGGGLGSFGDIEPMVDLCDIWIDDNTVATFWLRSHATFAFHPVPLAVMDWVDTESTPYLTLGYSDIPDTPLKMGPAVKLAELDFNITSLANLTMQQGNRQKFITTYEPGGEGDARKLMRTPDGGVVPVANLDRIGQFVVPGVDAGTLSLLMNLLGLFDTSAGNLTALMGLGAQTATVGQESLIHQAGNRKIEKMSDKVLDGVSRAFRAIAVLMWHDDFAKMSMRFQIPGAEEYGTTLTWSANERAGNFWDYNFKCVPASLKHETPDAEIAQIKSLLAEVYAPLMQVLMAQGGSLDMFALTERFAKLLDKPWLADLIEFTGQEAQRPDASADVRKPPSSTRHYVRHNTGGQGGPQNQFFEQAQQVGGGGSQPLLSGPRSLAAAG